MRALLTCGRLPVTLDIARALHHEGVEVWVTDSLTAPMARFSRYVQRYVKLPAPARNAARYRQAILDLVGRHTFDLIVPIHEETLYLASLKELLPSSTKLFCAPIPIIRSLHSKYEVLTMIAGCGVIIPDSRRLTSFEDFQSLGKDFTNFILKPEFSRGAFHVRYANDWPTQEQFQRHQPWIAQEYIKGELCCSASILSDGHLIAHAAYEPLYRLGQGAGLYFEPLTNSQIQDFVRQLAAKHNLTGHFCFDFIRNTQDQLYVIECNVRTTAGLHLLDHSQRWGRSYLNYAPGAAVFGMSADARMALLPILACYLGPTITGWSLRKLMQDMRRARDIIWSWHDPLPSLMQGLGVCEILAQSRSKPLDQLYLQDCEWNGEV